MALRKAGLIMEILIICFFATGVGAQSFRLELDAGLALPGDFWTRDSLLLSGTVEALDEGDSLQTLFYRMDTASDWLAWPLKGNRAGTRSFSLVLKPLAEGYQVLELSVGSRLHPTPDTVLFRRAWITDRTPPALLQPAELFQVLTDSLTLRWAVWLTFSEALSAFHPAQLSLIGQQVTLLSGDSAFQTSILEGARWQAVLTDRASTGLDSLLARGVTGLSVAAAVNWAVDLAGNSAQATQVPLQPQPAGIIEQFQLLTPAFSPNGDARQDTLQARCRVSRNAILHWALYSEKGTLVDREYLPVSPTDGVLSRSGRGILQEISEGDIQILWHPSFRPDSLADGRFRMVLYAQLPGKNAESDFLVAPLLLDRTPPEIQWLNPAAGDGSVPIRADQAFALLPAEDSLGTPIVSARMQFHTITDSNQTVHDSLWLPMALDSVSGRFRLDLAARQFALQAGPQQVKLDLTDLAGNQIRRMFTYSVSSETGPSNSPQPFNYPNPFNPRNGEKTTITFFQNNTDPGILEIYDFAGRIIFRKRIPAPAVAGVRRTFFWNGRNLQGEIVPTGVYFARIHLGIQKSALWRIVVKNFEAR